LEDGSQVEIIQEPLSTVNLVNGSRIILEAQASSLGTINYQWQVDQQNTGPTSRSKQWENISNGQDYLGTQSNRLIILNPTTEMNGWRFRMIAFSPCFICGDVVETTPSQLVYTPLSIPKAFSPNGDGFNDTWVIKGLDNYRTNRLTIYNRWETKVYEKTNYQNNWDGSSYIAGFGGENTLPNGVYFYLLELDNEEPITGYIYLKNE
jgi:gliding motility-associated-like protein